MVRFTLTIKRFREAIITYSEHVEDGGLVYTREKGYFYYPHYGLECERIN